MKKFFLSSIALVALLSSCSDDDGQIVIGNVEDVVDDTPVTGLGSMTTLDDGSILVEGTFIDEDVTFGNTAEYILDGRVIFGQGSSLTVNPGAIVKGREGTGSLASSLIIGRGAEILAEGTAAQPIIFTSTEDQITLGETESTVAISSSSRGLWGGVVVLGNAPISAGGNAIAGSEGAEAQIEGIPDNVTEGAYGGDISDDNSGILTYVSIRYAGTDISTDNELNGLTLGGVGSGTVIDNIEIFAGFDDGVEFFGGSVDASNIIVNGQGDDAIDADQGYSGTISNVLVISNDSNSGFELDGPEASFLSDSFYTITDATLIGGSNARIAELKSGAAARISNVLALNYTTEEIQVNGDSAIANNNSGATVLADWEIVDTRMASAIVTSEDSADVVAAIDSSFLTVIANEADAAVGADTSVFTWTQSSILGDF